MTPTDLVRAYRAALARPDFGRADLQTYAAILFATDDRRLSDDRLAALSRQDRKTVRKSRDRLLSAGLVTMDRRRAGPDRVVSTVYRVTVESAPAPTGESAPSFSPSDLNSEKDDGDLTSAAAVTRRAQRASNRPWKMTSAAAAVGAAIERAGLASVAQLVAGWPARSRAPWDVTAALSALSAPLPSPEAPPPATVSANASGDGAGETSAAARKAARALVDLHGSACERIADDHAIRRAGLAPAPWHDRAARARQLAHALDCGALDWPTWGQPDTPATDAPNPSDDPGLALAHDRVDLRQAVDGLRGRPAGKLDMHAIAHFPAVAAGQAAIRRAIGHDVIARVSSVPHRRAVVTDHDQIAGLPPPVPGQAGQGVGDGGTGAGADAAQHVGQMVGPARPQLGNRLVDLRAGPRLPPQNRLLGDATPSAIGAQGHAPTARRVDYPAEWGRKIGVQIGQDFGIFVQSNLLAITAPGGDGITHRRAR